MHIENLTDDIVPIFLGIVVPARGSLPVPLELVDTVKSSPLIQELVGAKVLSVHGAAVAEEAVIPAPLADPKIETSSTTKK